MAEDFLQKFLFEDQPIKGSLVRLDASWAEVCSRAAPPRAARDLLGEAISASVLLTSNIKFRGCISLQIQSAGPVRLVLGQCSDRRDVRGVVTVGGSGAENASRESVLSINLEPADGGVPYQGIVGLGRQGLASALQEYFTMSEQLDTRFFLSAKRQACAGLMLQRMPGGILDPDAWNRIVQLASTVSDVELLALDSQELLYRLFHEERVRLFEADGVQFGCRCSVERVSAMLRSLGEAETSEIIEELGSVDVRCEYCGSKYHFDPVDIALLFAKDGPPAPTPPGPH
jgi:molecular chaperone Hsp33